MKKRPIKFKNLPKSHLPAVIPPRSLVILATVDPATTPDWLGDRGRLFRIGYYSQQDGTDCIWLVNSGGEYEQSIDRDTLFNHFIVLKLSNEIDVYGTHSRPLRRIEQNGRPMELVGSFA